MHSQPPRALRFDAFTLDLARCILLHGDSEVPLRPQAFDVLRYLVEHAGRTVTKDELLAAVWPAKPASDDSLVQCIMDIRQALGDGARQFVRTVPRRGYLFTADVSTADAGAPADPAAAGPPRAQRLLGTAVGYARSTGWRGAAVLAAGLLVVAAGVIVRAGRAPVAANAAHYASRANNLLRTERSAQVNRKALALYRKALEIDPDNVPALLGYGRVLIVNVTEEWTPPSDRAMQLAQAEAAIERAIELDGANAQAHYRRGVLWRLQGAPVRALASLRRSLALNPNLPWTRAQAGRCKIDLGRGVEALADIEVAIRMRPAEVAIHIWYYWAGLAATVAADHDAAVRWILRMREAHRGDYGISALLLAVAYAELGREGDGRAVLAAYRATRPDLSLAALDAHFPPHNAALAAQRTRLAGVLRRLGLAQAEMQTGSARPH